jgi:hypothetical protein
VLGVLRLALDQLVEDRASARLFIAERTFVSSLSR